ncbi:ribosomal protein S6 kinase delta-1-like protein, partial [Leptotrombidium deliense]
CNHHLSEDKVRNWLLQIITALDHLHSHGVYYLDLNPNNILIDEREDQIYLTYKCKLDDNELMSTNCHYKRSIYIAPEVYSNIASINQQVDWWSLGVITYELLTSRSLQSYYPRGISENCDLIYFPHFISPEAKDLIIEIDPKLRLGRYGVEDIKTHPFFLKLE